MKDPSSPQLRVLFLFPEVFANGGIQRFNRTILEACSLLNLRCSVLSLNDPPARIEALEPQTGARVVGFGGNRRRFAMAASAALWCGSYDRVLVGHVNLLTLAAAVLALRPFRRPRALLIAHGIEVWNGIGPARRAGLSRMARILCVSRYTRQRILEQSPGLPAVRLRIFPNALAVSWERDAPAAAAAPGERFILSVTRLERGDRYKGVASVIEAFSMLEDRSLRYYVIGQGNDLPFLQRAAERFGVQDRVRFLGGVGDAELISLYRSCDAFVLPSGKEGFGIVFLEAMYFGAPVIAAAEKGALDVIRDGETGLAVRFGDAIAIKEAIERIRADASLRRHLCANGRATVVDGGEFTFGRFTRRCAEIFDFGSTAARQDSI